MPFELQGHRGARGQAPENTLPSFEAALQCKVSTIETDVHLTRDGVPVLCHDPVLNDAIVSVIPGRPAPATRSIAQLTLEELRRFRANGNPDPSRFPGQYSGPSFAAHLFAQDAGIDIYGVPTLAEFLDFVAAYAGPLGVHTGKALNQRERAQRVRLDLELKRVPFEPENIGDDFDGSAPGLLERRVVEEVRRAGVVERTIVRSFDHRCLRAIRELEPRLTTAVLIADTAPVSPGSLAREVGATIYGPDYRFVDAALVRLAHKAGLRVIPWTVNRSEDWERLLAWGVDGVTTDYPDRLAVWLREHGVEIL